VREMASCGTNVACLAVGVPSEDSGVALIFRQATIARCCADSASRLSCSCQI
jgi:hypothetical protein